MELIISILVIYFLIAIWASVSRAREKSTHNDRRVSENKQKTEDLSDWPDFDGFIKISKPDQNKKTVHDNSNSLSKKTGDNGHSANVWKTKGYRVKRGESPAYRYYGNDIYTFDQVIKIVHDTRNYDYLDVDNEPHLTSNQRKVKTLGYALVKQHGSKRKAKDILVSSYGYDEETAKYATGYNGYSDW